MKLLLVVLALLNLGFVALTIAEWKVMSGPAKKLLALLCLGIFPFFWGIGVMHQDLVRMRKVSFCANCHTMTEYVESLSVDDDEPLSAVHYQNNWVPQKNACYICHTNYTMFGPVKAKMTGLKHLWVYYITGPPKKLKLYEPYKNRDCLRCHGPAKSYTKEKKHRKDKKLLEQLNTGERSCIERGCHDLGHLLESEFEDDEGL